MNLLVKVKKKVSGFTEDSNSQTVKVKGNLPMREMNADVIIVAAGPAGLAAAVTVGEHNLSSIVFEKSNTTGGAANMGMGPLGIDTKVQRRGFNQITVEKALDLHMDYTHWRVDADLVSTYFHKSADTIEWLESMGVEFCRSVQIFCRIRGNMAYRKTGKRSDRTSCSRRYDQSFDKSSKRTWCTI